MTDDLQHIISSKRELLARGDAPRPVVNYTVSTQLFPRHIA